MNKQCKRNLKLDGRQWVDNVARNGETALIAGEVRNAFANFRRLAKIIRPVSTPIFDTNDHLTGDKSHKLECWRNHCTKLFNRPNVSDFEELITTAAQSALKDPTINYSGPTAKEVINCLHKIKNDKAPEKCSITPEMMKGLGSGCSIRLTNIFHDVWLSGIISSDWKKALSYYSMKGKER